MVHVLAAHLFRRHVADCAHHRAGIGLNLSRRDFRLRHAFFDWLDEFCQTEVEDLDAIVSGDEEIVRFQIAMDDALFVRGGETM